MVMIRRNKTKRHSMVMAMRKKIMKRCPMVMARRTRMNQGHSMAVTWWE
jgi:hypothetical protein